METFPLSTEGRPVDTGEPSMQTHPSMLRQLLTQTNTKQMTGHRCRGKEGTGPMERGGGGRGVTRDRPLTAEAQCERPQSNIHSLSPLPSPAEELSTHSTHSQSPMCQLHTATPSSTFHTISRTLDPTHSRDTPAHTPITTHHPPTTHRATQSNSLIHCITPRLRHSVL